MPTKPPPTPWGEVIRLAREAQTPKMSVKKAAGLAGISAENWGHVERGYQWLTRNRKYQVTPGTASTVAHMAFVVGVSPDRLREAGNPSAAEVLEEMIRQATASGTGTGTDGRSGAKYVDPTDEYLSHTPGLSDDEVRGLIVLARHFRQESETGSGSGSSR